MQIHIVPILSDNYCYIVETDTDIAVIDPGEAEAVLAYLKGHDLTPNWIINTHKHRDHVDGNARLLQEFDGCKLAAPDECSGDIDLILADGDMFDLGHLEFEIILTAGHTAGHIVLFEPHEKILFSGDTLFVMGCGRLFEGSAEQMFHAMQRIKALPPETKIYCGHEYTLSNAKFAHHIMPDNQDIANRLEIVKGQSCTVPTTLGEELKTNPFLIAETVDQFAEYREGKDRF